jgi:hypothetical protein
MTIEHIIEPAPPVDVSHVEAELTAFLGGDTPPAELRMRGPFAISDSAQADWCMERLAELDHLARDYADRILLWQEAQKRAVAARAWFETRLSEWAAARRTKTVKSFPLAHGTISTREVQPRVTVVDEDAAVAWAKQHAPDAVKTTHSLLVSKVGDRVRLWTVVTGYNAIHQTTGETQHIDVDPPQLADPKVLTELRARMEGYTVEPITTVEARDDKGRPVPGFGVIDGKVSVTVKPLGL